jgi:hypothetical protein
MHVTHPYIPCLLSESKKKKIYVVQLNSSEFIQTSSSIHPSIRCPSDPSETKVHHPHPTHTGPLETLVRCASPPPQRPEAAERPGSFEAAADAGRHIHHARCCTCCARTMHGKSIRACVSGTSTHTGFPYTYMHGTQGWWLIVAGSRLKPRSSSAFPVLFEAAHIGIFFAA